jgi:putative FmdB family regulatory protein
MIKYGMGDPSSIINCRSLFPHARILDETFLFLYFTAMPTYDYKCPKCSSKFEKFHSISENPDVKCPDCGTTSSRQIGGGAGIMFKGSGFYVNDYKSASAKAPVSATAEKAATAPKACAGGGACGCA